MMYGIEVINPNTEQLKKMDKITADYARWILGTSPHSQTIATLTTCDLKPIKYDIMKQQINYFYTIIHRHKDNITNIFDVGCN